MPSKKSKVEKSKIINALHALTCYSVKDIRFHHQFNSLVTLMPHISSALSMVSLGGKGVTVEVEMLEKILYIKLLELKGFACTQTGAVAEAAEPLKQCYDQLMALIKGGTDLTIQESTFKDSVEDKIAIGDKAKQLWDHCKHVALKIPKPVFTYLARTVVVNSEDIQLLSRNAPTGKLPEKIKENQPLDSEALKVFMFELF